METLSLLLRLLAAAAVLAGPGRLAAAPSPVRGQQAPRRLEPYELEGAAILAPPLSPRQVAALERALARRPDDEFSRARLLAHYHRLTLRARGLSARARAGADHLRHVLWVIDHKPASAVAGITAMEVDANTDREGFARAKRLWLQQADAHPRDTRVLGNAAGFLLLAAPVDAERLLLRAREAAPSDPEWPDRLGQLYRLGLPDEPGPARSEQARKALAAYEAAMRLAGGPERYDDLEDLAEVAVEAGSLDSARRYADALLRGAGRDARDGNAIHHGNLVLGRIALREGRLEDARQRLLAAGRTPGSPQLDSFGPNMLLAKELLDRGERQAVLAYLGLCARFWRDARLKEWKADVTAGRTPDFGPNLSY